MKYSTRIATAVLAATSLNSVFAQTWCGKNYMPNQTVVLPGGQFQLPATSAEPLVAFRCSPAFRPYLEEDAKDAAVVVDTPIVYQYLQGASPVSFTGPGWNSSEYGALGKMEVTISIGNKVFTTEEVPLNTTGYEISLDLSSLQAQKAHYSVSCNATYQAETSSSSAKQYFSANAPLLYLPDNNGSVVKTDLRTGTLWARPADGKDGNFQPFVPQGFYIEFDPSLVQNLSYIDQLKEEGFNTIHPIPPFDNVTVFEQVLNKTVELGLYLIFDMRTIYQNLTAVAVQIEAYKSLPNLLLWETAHEPDGNSDPLDAALNTYDLIYQLDGYHPVSIVLNCQDYNFSPYVEGADIVLEDAYPIGINATYSPVWHTECTPNFGHCGCDNCQGHIYDVTARIQTFKDRLNILGYGRTKAIWAIPQAFGGGAFWNTTPAGQEWAAMSLTSFSHGATGSISFRYPSSSGNVTTIEGTAQYLTGIITNIIQSFITDPKVTYETFYAHGVDASLWNNGTAYLLLVANVDSSVAFMPWADVGLGTLTNVTTQVHRFLSVDQHVNETGLHLFLPNSVGIYAVTPPK